MCAAHICCHQHTREYTDGPPEGYDYPTSIIPFCLVEKYVCHNAASKDKDHGCPEKFSKELVHVLIVYG